MTRLPDYTVKTYRYLRLGMVVLVVMLGAAIGIERAQVDPGCWQTSISGYWFTPVRAVLVGTLVSIGVCLVVLKGNTEREDAALNVAGMLAPVVAFVPTTFYEECWSAAPPSRDVPADVANNMGALFVGAVLALAFVAAAVALRAMRGRADLRHVAGVVLVGVLVAAAYAWFALARESFEGAAHYAAAVPMFVCFVAVMVINAWSFGKANEPRRRTRRRAYANRYLAVAVVTVAATVGLGLARLLTGWDHALLWIEAVVIAGFAVFWLIQTHELWHQGVRGAVPADPRDRAARR